MTNCPRAAKSTSWFSSTTSRSRRAAPSPPRVALYGHAEFQESWQSIQYMIFDSAKRIVERFGLTARSTHLDKGNYVPPVPRPPCGTASNLKACATWALMLDQKLSSSVNLDFYSDPDGVNTGDSDFGAHSLPPGGRACDLHQWPQPRRFAEER